MHFVSPIRSFIGTHIHAILLCFLLLMIGTKLFAYYLDSIGSVKRLELHYETQYLGRDLQQYSVLPAYQVRTGIVPYIFGYGSVLIATITTQFFELIHICPIQNAEVCGHTLFQIMSIMSILGLYILIYVTLQKEQRYIGILLYSIFLLGVPFSKSIEAGNIDSVVFLLYGYCLLLCVSLLQRTKNAQFIAMCIGGILGLLLNIKAFFLPFVFVSLWAIRSYRPALVIAILSYSVCALWPWLYGVHSGLFDVFLFAVRGSDAFGYQLYTQINYGNNAVVSYVSNILQAVDVGHVSTTVHILLTYSISICVFIVLFILPWWDVRVRKVTISQLWTYIRSTKSVAFFMLLYAYATVSILTMTAWSYDYRIVYVIPVLCVLLAHIRQETTKQLLYISVLCLLIKCLWIPKDRILNIFLYAHYYFLLRAAISYWLDTVSTRTYVHRKK